MNINIIININIKSNIKLKININIDINVNISPNATRFVATCSKRVTIAEYTKLKNFVTHYIHSSFALL